MRKYSEVNEFVQTFCRPLPHRGNRHRFHHLAPLELWHRFFDLSTARVESKREPARIRLVVVKTPAADESIKLTNNKSRAADGAKESNASRAVLYWRGIAGERKQHPCRVPRYYGGNKLRYYYFFFTFLNYFLKAFKVWAIGGQRLLLRSNRVSFAAGQVLLSNCNYYSSK